MAFNGWRASRIHCWRKTQPAVGNEFFNRIVAERTEQSQKAFSPDFGVTDRPEEDIHTFCDCLFTDGEGLLSECFSEVGNMAWTPPPPPSSDYDSIVAYWRAILDIPLNETGAELLRDMASQRLAELHAGRTRRGGQLPAGEV